MRVNHVTAPSVLSSGVEIYFIEHKSDFVRMAVINEWGGTYMDTDVFTIRDNKPLREAGFRNLAGRQANGLTSNGVFMAQPNSAMMNVWIKIAYEIFDGGWDTAGSGLLCRIAERLTVYPNEVLILDQKVWAPTNWEGWSANQLFEPTLGHGDSAATVSSVKPEEVDPAQWWDIATEGQEDGEIDFSSTYAIHTFIHRGAQVPNFTGISPEYVFSRRSNFARAVYPAAKHALDSGLFAMNDFEDTFPGKEI